ncbi:MAG TPA: F0F1 ATP synthase subunit A [Terriglobales bacterium]|nr:F0F1 ATP synthase subunit A [Terriglobales bacterium]
MALIAFSSELPFTALMNKLFGGVALSVMEQVGVHAHDPAHPIPNWMAMQFLVAGVLLLFFAFLRTRLSVEKPGGWQHLLEGVHTFIQNQSREIIGHHSEAYTPFLVALGLFIFTANMVGVVPGFESPTANPSVPLGCAVAAFAYYNWQGVRKQGVVHYAAHFAGPSDPSMSLFIRLPLAIVMVPIEIISHLARMLSLTVRLFANIFAGDMVTLVFFSLVPVGVPVAFNLLHVGVSFLQAYIFVLLTTVYLAGAVAEEH